MEENNPLSISEGCYLRVQAASTTPELEWKPLMAPRCANSASAVESVSISSWTSVHELHLPQDAKRSSDYHLLIALGELRWPKIFEAPEPWLDTVRW